MPHDTRQHQLSRISAWPVAVMFSLGFGIFLLSAVVDGEYTFAAVTLLAITGSIVVVFRALGPRRKDSG